MIIHRNHVSRRVEEEGGGVRRVLLAVFRKIYRIMKTVQLLNSSPKISLKLISFSRCLSLAMKLIIKFVKLKNSIA